MATKAFVSTKWVTADNNPTKGHFVYTASFFGDNVTPGDVDTQGPVEMESIVTITASSVQLKNQIIEDVIAEGAARGLTIGNGDIILGSLEIV